MPLLFLGHGSPMNAVNENEFYKNFKKIAETFPKPKAILCISAHWIDNVSSITAMENPKIIYDFSGFPAEIYEIEYKVKGDKDLANKVKELLSNIEEINLDEEYWGLDHGSWMPIRAMYPDADVPVVQLSLKANELEGEKYFDYAVSIGEKLRSLREENILIIASGNIVHNFKYLNFKNIDVVDNGDGWARNFQNKINTSVINRDFNTLKNYKEIENGEKAMETIEHYLPLFYILGASDQNDKVEIFNDDIVGASLSMTSYIFR